MGRDTKFDEMSREELVELAGVEDDPSISRADLIMLAIEQNNDH